MGEFGWAYISGSTGLREAGGAVPGTGGGAPKWCSLRGARAEAGRGVEDDARETGARLAVCC